MSTSTGPRRRLPARVYWTRRALVVGVALALVFGIGSLLGGSPDESGSPSAEPAAASAGSPMTGQTTPGPTGDATSVAGNQAGETQETRTVKTPLAVPTGPCADSDVLVTPSAPSRAYAGRDVTITLNLSTVDSPACDWEVSSDSVVLKLTSGRDRIWSTQDCPTAIDPESVVVRKGHVTQVGVTWSGQRSDDECTRTTLWAQPGYYHAEAASLGAEPGQQQFRLLTPPRPTITPEPTLEPKKPGKKQTKNH